MSLRTPRFFSHPIARKLLPEAMAGNFKAKAEPVWLAADYRCQLSYYDYRPVQDNSPCWLMLEPRDHLGAKGEQARPATPESISKAFKAHGVSSKTTQAIDPLLFWARHVDLALDHRRGTLIFAPWITQGELLSLFRCAAVGAIQPNFAGSASAGQIIEDIECFGNDELMREATATSSLNEPWSADEWLKGVRKLPQKERRAYLNEFGANLRFWPDQSVFRPVIQTWKEQADKHLGNPQSDTGNPWFSHYMEMFSTLRKKTS
ncbi:hypothetical protein [Marinobacter sp. ELB17]|uniref:hypothetical protein n=1 Tax=Marinobacter sp. ELB17 TaxID=270374 RepID=UPI0012F4F49A|nr:hypothetical protein [Marinobacter sp. ELB17]